ncbi:MAG: flagellar hook protein FlgE [bacterium]|nr:flagellar hook protein FlgE [bacterium]
MTGIYGAMYAANSGLQVQGQQLGTIGDDIANQGTIGYKSKRAAFSTLVTGPGSPGGVRSRVIQGVGEQGLLQTSSSDTDLAISGNGFFIVGKTGEATALSPQEYSYTRSGAFVRDNEGNLQNTAGYYLQGWRTDEKGVPLHSNRSTLSNLETIQVSQVSGFSRPSTKVDLAVNLKSDEALNGAYDVNIEVYDSLGIAHDLKFTYERTQIDPMQWSVSVECEGAAQVLQDDALGGAYNNVVIQFDENGLPQTFDGGLVPPEIHIVWDNGITSAADMTLEVKMGTVGESDGLVCKGTAYNIISRNQDGIRLGNFTGVNIDEEGVVHALFDNGETRKIYRVALANFANPDALEEKSGNVWTQTDQSGGYVLYYAKTYGVGRVASRALEASTVDISTKLTTMILTQNAFSANAKVIQKGKEMLDDLKAL